MKIKAYDTTVHTVKPAFKSLQVQKSGLFARFPSINRALFLKSIGSTIRRPRRVEHADERFSDRVVAAVFRGVQ